MFLLLFSFALADNLWATAPVEGVRWLDSPAVTLTLEAGDEVEVLLRDGARVRVRKGIAYGWVAASSLTDVAPTPSLPLASPSAVPAAPAAAPAAAPPGTP